MAQISFDVAKQLAETQNSGGNSVSFFTLKNDGDEALVRILYDNTSEFEIFAVHEVEVPINGSKRRRKISCLRNPQDSIDMCPLCAAGNSTKNSFFIKMLQYTQNEQGQIQVTPVIWERSISYATKLKNLLDEYGPLSDCIFKIKRSGAAGSRDTTYEFFFGNPKMYPNEVFVKDTSGFDNYKILGTLVQDRTYDDIMTFVNAGNFPVPNSSSTSQVTAPAYTPKGDTSVPFEVGPSISENVSSVTTTPFGSAMPNIENSQYVPVQSNNPTAPRQVANNIPTNTTSPTGAPPQRATRYY